MGALVTGAYCVWVGSPELKVECTVERWIINNSDACCPVADSNCNVGVASSLHEQARVSGPCFRACFK